MNLETARTLIDPISLADASFFLELVNTPSFLKYIGDRNVRSLDDAIQFLKQGILKSYSDKGYGYYAVRLRTTGNAIGTCGFLKKPYLDYEDFGFAFLSEFQGQGFGYESANVVLEFGIQQFGFKNLDAVVQPDNLASIGLLKKLGFVENGKVLEPESETELMRFRFVVEDHN